MIIDSCSSDNFHLQRRDFQHNPKCLSLMCAILSYPKHPFQPLPKLPANAALPSKLHSMTIPLQYVLLLPANYQSVEDGSEDGKPRAVPAIRQGIIPRALALQDHVHILLHPAEDVSAPMLNGKTERLAVTHFLLGHVTLALERHARQERQRFDDDAAWRRRNGEFDFCSEVSCMAHELVGDFELFDLACPWMKSTVQLSDGAGVEQVVGDAESILEEVDVCNLVASLLADLHQCRLKLQAMTTLAVFGFVLGDMDGDLDVFEDSFAVDLVSQLTWKLAEKGRVELGALLCG